MSQVSHRQGIPDRLTEGLSAYAAEQAAMERHIHTQWSTLWAVARGRAEPILRAALGRTDAPGPALAGLDIIELQIEEEYDSDGGNSDFEE